MKKTAIKKTSGIFNSYTSRLALLYAVIFSASTLLLFYFFYLFTASYMTQQLDDTIQAEIQGLAERYNARGLGGLTALIADRVNRQQAQATGNSIYLLTNYALRPIVGNLDRWPKHTALENDWIEFELVIDRDAPQNHSATHMARARIFRLPRHRLLVGRDINQLTEAKRRIVQGLGWGLGFMVLLALAGGVLLGRPTARKIARINQTTHSIMSGDLSRRVAVTRHNDDFDQVAENLNRMLDQIQSLMEDIRRVSDSIAHDLRTPLSRLRQHLEQARRVETHSRTARYLEDSIEEADALLSTFNALLRIARVEAGQIKSGFGTIDFDALIADVIEFYEPLAEEKQQILTATLAAVRTSGDRDLIFQAVANVIENAVKYTPRRGVISVALAKRGNNAVITIADNGPGIPAPERTNVFRRFYRLDRSRSSSGNGLGLSMVAAVVAMHNGTIKLTTNRVKNNRGNNRARGNRSGLKTVITLPLSSPLSSNVRTAGGRL